MRGTVIQRGPNSWSAVVYQAGKQKWLSAKSESEAWRKLYEYETGIYIDPSKMTLEVYLDFWLADRQRDWSTETYRTYSAYLKNHVNTEIGAIKLDKLVPLQIRQTYIKMLDKELSPSTIKTIHQILSSALNRAVKWDMLQRNPCKAVDPPRQKKSKPELLTPDQLKQVLQLLNGKGLYMPVLLASVTGARRGELCALEWTDIDLDKHFIHIYKAAKRGEGKKEIIISTTKQDRERYVAITPGTVSALKKHKARQSENRLFYGQKYQENNLVCCKMDGRLWVPNLLSMSWWRFVQKHELPDVTFHSLRHFHGSMLLAGGTNIKTISDRLGHSSIKITSDIYLHTDMGLQKEAIANLDTLLSLPISKSLAD